MCLIQHLESRFVEEMFDSAGESLWYAHRNNRLHITRNSLHLFMVVYMTVESPPSPIVMLLRLEQEAENQHLGVWNSQLMLHLPFHGHVRVPWWGAGLEMWCRSNVKLAWCLHSLKIDILKNTCVLTAGAGALPWCGYTGIQLSWVVHCRRRLHLGWVRLHMGNYSSNKGHM